MSKKTLGFTEIALLIILLSSLIQLSIILYPNFQEVGYLRVSYEGRELEYSFTESDLNGYPPQVFLHKAQMLESRAIEGFTWDEYVQACNFVNPCVLPDGSALLRGELEYLVLHKED
jgi:hypothetical protein